jgi:phosphoribosylaminoimidazole-succinocarboxamide synthase
MLDLSQFSNPNFPFFGEGKVRASYDMADDPKGRLIVATDRISAFDVIMSQPVPGKGRLLTQMTVNWIRQLEKDGVIIPLSSQATEHGVFHHLLTSDLSHLPLQPEERAALDGRTMLVMKADYVLPIEAIVRNYLEGSGYTSYIQNGTICGIKLPDGLRRCSRLPEFIFSPSTKAEQGQHDANISFNAMVDILSEFFVDRGIPLDGLSVTEAVRRLSLEIYSKAHDYALGRGVIIADTKFEFGLVRRAGVWCLMLIDELLTPDSSRFWDADSYAPGRVQASFDKQILRNWLQALVDSGDWNKKAPAPTIDPTILEITAARYEEINRRLFG